MNTITGTITAANNYSYGQAPNIAAGQFTTSRTLPTGLSLSTTYYVVANNTSSAATTFKIYPTQNDAQNLTNVIIPSTGGTGIHTFTSDETFNGNQHAHWEVEATDSGGTNLFGRFEIPYDQDISPILFNLADVTLTNNSGKDDGRLFFAE